MESEAKITTHTVGNRMYNARGTSAGSTTSLMIEMEFKSGRKVPERNKPDAVESASRSMENRAKLTEKRLSMVQSTFRISPRRSAIASATKRGLWYRYRFHKRRGSVDKRKSHSSPIPCTHGGA